MRFDRGDVIQFERERRLNLARLRDCRGPHEFALIQDGEVFLRYRCKVCCGEVTADQHWWYHRGLDHSKLAK